MSVEIYLNIVPKDVVEAYTKCANPYLKIDDYYEFEIVSFGRPEKRGWELWNALKSYSNPLLHDEDVRLICEVNFDDVADSLTRWNAWLEAQGWHYSAHDAKREALVEILHEQAAGVCPDAFILRFSH